MVAVMSTRCLPATPSATCPRLRALANELADLDAEPHESTIELLVGPAATRGEVNYFGDGPSLQPYAASGTPVSPPDACPSISRSRVAPRAPGRLLQTLLGSGNVRTLH